MTIEQTVEIPVGRTILTFTPVPTEARDIELINQNAERLNREALDVLSFQSADLSPIEP